MRKPAQQIDEDIRIEQKVDIIHEAHMDVRDPGDLRPLR